MSPKSFDADDFTRLFESEIPAVGQAISWAGDWNYLAVEKEAPEAVAVLGKIYGYTPVVIANVYSAATGPLRPLDEANQASYKQKAVEYARQYQPPYMGLGIEVNLFRERWPDDFEAFVALFDETYDLIKAESPDTQVFTVFQLERLGGFQGGLFGGTNDPAQAEWDIFDRFPKADFFAFTTYPGIVFGSPDEIPDDYYSAITQHTDKPIAFTEIGWPSEVGIEGWGSSEDEQAAFVQRFFDLTAGLAPKLEIWSFLYDQGLSDPFQGLGLLRPDGSQRPAWQAWNDRRSLVP